MRNYEKTILHPEAHILTLNYYNHAFREFSPTKVTELMPFIFYKVDSPFEKQRENHGLLNSASSNGAGTKKMNKRSQRIYELYETEKRFVNILHTIIYVISIDKRFKLEILFNYFYAKSFSKNRSNHQTRWQGRYWTRLNAKKSLVICHPFMRFIAK